MTLPEAKRQALAKTPTQSNLVTRPHVGRELQQSHTVVLSGRHLGSGRFDR